MRSYVPRAVQRALIAGMFASPLACQDEFPLGSWDRTADAGGIPSNAGESPTGGTSALGGTGGTAGTGVITPLPSPTCGERGIPGPLNYPGTLSPGNVGTTNLYTDWSWPTPVDSLEWDLVLETDPVTDGYYWAHQFSFVNGLTGFFGLQAHGGYQTTLTAKIDAVKMAVFWIGGGQLGAELGDIPYPDARTLVVNARGADWQTIHAKFAWTACHVYHLKIAKNGSDDYGNIWYGAWIDDRTTGASTFIGRIAVPLEWGQLSRLSTTITTRIDNIGQLITLCNQPEPASAIFGTPSANDGTILPTHINRFVMPPRCPSSRFTELPEGVRHEIGLR
jgi:hypothetical protein